MSDAHAVHTLSTLDTDLVIDLGCCSYERNGRLEDSIVTLVKRFAPKLLLGFDPHPALAESIGKVHGSTVMTTRRAAWTHDGFTDIEVQGNCTHIVEENTSSAVTACFDLAAWVRMLPDVKIVLKLDVEGAEYVLLPHLIEQGVADRFTRVLVEWHEGRYANGYSGDRAAIIEELGCPVEDWQ